ncbi:type IV pilus modification protein PilV [Thioalkalivibrio sp. ALE19]|uniref:type IV pilus modification protein PilV n=1 Tax=Thioalkalivibrio sp. ALE19 TaxID=1266909 RepID=UPI00041F216F|nr:type IV pilus modification protein PilV [Thioalkalivibrio sp. ALE19]
MKARSIRISGGRQTRSTVMAQAGFTLIEILVALIIISVGLLGLAGAQMLSLQSSQTSYERTIAVIQSRDLVERLWAGICDVYDDGGDLEGGDENTIVEQWGNDHDGTLGDPDEDSWDPTVSADSEVITITIEWDSRREDDDGETVQEQFTHHARVPNLECD